MSVFEVDYVVEILNTGQSRKAKQDFRDEWTREVKARVDAWKKVRATTHQACNDAQLLFTANIIHYVNIINKTVKPNTNAKSIRESSPSKLPINVPILGPRFIPPSYASILLRDPAAHISPETMYLKPVTTIHPLYFPQISQCPRLNCKSKDFIWNSWTGTGPRRVHGVQYDETAIGYQLRCKKCNHSTATTSYEFWESVSHFGIPRGIPFFFKRCAVTRELYSLTIENRVQGTSAGMEENYKQLHLLEYFERQLEFLHFSDMTTKVFKFSSKSRDKEADRLAAFSGPYDTDGYDDDYLKHDMITELYIQFVERTRQDESTAYMKTITGRAYSLDNTFKVGSKATLTNKQRSHRKIMKGGICSIINENNEIVTWRLCQTQSAAEITELLEGLNRRHAELGLADPEIITVDNCCHVRNAILKVFPDVKVRLDVYHFMIRYLVVIHNGTRNPYRSEVAQDIIDAIHEKGATKDSPAVYRSQAEQKERLTAMYEKWEQRGGVWSAAATATHSEQLKHVEKGCLAHTLQDVRIDGSRIEGSHKGWNSLQRSFASGLTVFKSLGHDWVLRRNVRVINQHDRRTPPFAMSTFGSHHVGLVNETAILWNRLLSRDKTRASAPSKYRDRPELPEIKSEETFGLVRSAHAASFGGLVDVKDESTEELEQLELRVMELHEDVSEESILREMRISPSLLLLPQVEHRVGGVRVVAQTQSVPTPSNASSFPEGAAQSVLDASQVTQTVSSSSTGANREIIDLSVDAGVAVSQSTATKRKVDTMIDVESETMACRPEDVTIVNSKTPKRARTMRMGALDAIDSSTVSDAAIGAVDATDSVLIANAASQTSPLPPSSATPTQSALYGAQNLLEFFRAAQSNMGKSQGFDLQPQQRLTDLDQEITKVQKSEDLPESLLVPDLRGLTRSELLFSQSTGIDIRALTINGNDEFYTFMDLRAKNKWASWSMTSHKWAVATQEYNIELKRVCSEKGITNVVPKNPRALMEKLGAIEPEILKRLASNDFTSKSSGKTEFWEKHCHAVPLEKNAENVILGMGSARTRAQRQAVCSRCKRIMYPKKTGSPENHPKWCCTDGAPVHLESPKKAKKQANSEDDAPVLVLESRDLQAPSFPQPAGIFKNGKTFDPIALLRELQLLYAKVIMQRLPASDWSVEDTAFVSLIDSRTDWVDGHPFFRLYPTLKLYPPLSSAQLSKLTFEHEGNRYLRLYSQPTPDANAERGAVVIP